ncbi:hypothetical protein MVEN_00496900 [Mycena venus]|uniref:Uncharacterized protein n=1 Tax=Mycena venus TaxID=2733690 RepID=A0A8H6YS51_9AGAR|nr:hypothetical protein MVEN_00496900 [Mycena venus]
MSHPYSGSGSHVDTNEPGLEAVQTDHIQYDIVPSFSSWHSSVALSPSPPSTSNLLTDLAHPAARTRRPRHQHHRPRPDSQEPLIPLPNAPSYLTHPYKIAHPLEEENAEFVSPLSAATLSPNRPPKGPAYSARRLTFTARDPLHGETQEHLEGGKRRRVGYWRRKIQKQIQRALLKLRRFLEAL